MGVFRLITAYPEIRKDYPSLFPFHIRSFQPWYLCLYLILAVEVNVPIIFTEDLLMVLEFEIYLKGFNQLGLLAQSEVF